MTCLIDRALLDEVSAAAAASPRLRRNRNFHMSDAYPAHRLLNGAEPDTYIAPHRHLDPAKDETLVILRGRMGVVLFDDTGKVTRAALMAPEGDCVGVDITHGQWHTFVALEPGTVIIEAKAGPYLPLTVDECAPWAPAENSVGVAAYLASLRDLFA